MNTRLTYRLLLPTAIDYLADSDALVGSYSQSERLLEDLRHAKAYKSPLLWFANLPADPRIEDIQAFTEKHGLLRSNWTQAGWGGVGDQFYLPVAGFRDSLREFRQNWGDKTWLAAQLAATPQVNSSLDIEPAEAWKLTQPHMALRCAAIKGGVEVRLVAGDLWQVLCCALLEKLDTHGWARMCANPGCKEARYFITNRRRKKFCSHYCAKLITDRRLMRLKRARLRRAGG